MRSLLLLTTSLLFVLLLGEGLLRFAGFTPRELAVNPQFTGNTWAKQDVELGWINREGEFLSNEFGNATMTFWPGSRRAGWHEPTKHTNRTVYVMGGSFTQGYGVKDEETYVYRLNRLIPGYHVS